MKYWYARTVIDYTKDGEWWAIGLNDNEIAYTQNQFTAQRITALLNDALARVEQHGQSRANKNI